MPGGAESAMAGAEVNAPGRQVAPRCVGGVALALLCGLGGGARWSATRQGRGRWEQDEKWAWARRGVDSSRRQGNSYGRREWQQPRGRQDRREEEKETAKGDAEKTRNGPCAKQRQVAVSELVPTVGWRSEKAVEVVARRLGMQRAAS